ncbi:MAG TPA: TPM domain-containing protein [Myxococcota bacterium]|nr:TPM domain-containing protein [Myxococcota bacterium]
MRPRDRFIRFCSPTRAALFALALLSFTGAVLSATARAVPVIDRPVVDQTGLLGGAALEEVAAQLVGLRERTGVQMAVLVVRSTDGVPIEEYAHETFDTWGGASKQRNDGVLFVLAVDDRRNRIEVGRGLEGLITDSRAVAILEGVKPRLREADYGAACREVVAGVAELVGHLTPDAAITIPAGPLELNTHHLVGLFGIPWLLGVIFILCGPKKKTDSRSKAWRQRLARLPTWPRKARLLGLLVAGPLLASLLLLALDGARYVGPNVFAWLVAAGLGVFGGLAIRKGPIRALIFGILLLIPIGLILAGPPEPVPTGLELISGAIALAFILVFTTTFFVADGEGGGSSSSSSWSSGSSSSSSSWSSSSSSSSSSWSGGGGSSGGGGASSSW